MELPLLQIIYMYIYRYMYTRVAVDVFIVADEAAWTTKPHPETSISYFKQRYKTRADTRCRHSKKSTIFKKEYIYSATSNIFL